jgi:transcriptional regulator of acetoin/glycerol metabolism
MVSFVRRLASAYPGAKTLSLSQVVRQFPELDESGERSVRASSTQPSGTPPAGRERRRADPRAFTAEEIEALRAAVERHQGNVASAAAELGMSRQRAYRLLKSGSE